MMPAEEGRGCRGTVGGGMGLAEGWMVRRRRGMNCFTGSSFKVSRAGLSWECLSCHLSEGKCCRIQCPATSLLCLGKQITLEPPCRFFCQIPCRWKFFHVRGKEDVFGGGTPPCWPSSHLGHRRQRGLSAKAGFYVPIPPLLAMACFSSSSPFLSTKLRKRTLPSAFPSPFSA